MNVSDVVPATVGVPERVAVPFALALNVTPDGRAPAIVNVGVGLPDAATVKFNADPTSTPAEAALVNVGSVPTRNVTATVSRPAPLTAVTLIG